MIPSLESSGLLPRGRFVCGLDDVERRFVSAAEYEGSATRADVWDDFLFLLAFLRRRSSVPAVFVAGSFVTDKIDPADIDASPLIDKASVQHEGTWGVINKALAYAQQRQPVNKRVLRVDAFLIPWDCQPEQTQTDSGYLLQRGNWDDWWQRSVPKDRRTPPSRIHGLPVAGYLEVIVDGYS